MATNEDTKTKKRGPTSPTITSESDSKRQRNENEEPDTTYIYGSFEHFEDGVDATTHISNLMDKKITVLGTKKVTSGYLLKMHDRDLQKCFEEYPHKLRPTVTTMKRKALCINKIDENITQNDLISKIEPALNQKIIYSTFENKLFLFLTDNFKNNQNINISITVNKKTFFIRNYDPITNYIQQCKSCHKFNHSKCENKTCRKCTKKDCTGNCARQDLKCINCNEPHSPYFKQCKTYKKILQEAFETRKKKIEKQKMENIATKISKTSLVAYDVKYSEIASINNRSNESAK